MAAGKARLPPRWFVVTFWHLHRWIVRVSGGRKGLWLPRPGKYGTALPVSLWWGSFLVETGVL